MYQDLSSFGRRSLWRRMPVDRRTEAAGLFWADDHSADQQIEAVASIASHMKFRARSVVGSPLDKKARYLAALPNVTDSIAARALVNYHLERQRPMIGAFLDLLGIPHENGLISEENVAKPDDAKVKRGRRGAHRSFRKTTVSALPGDTRLAGSRTTSETRTPRRTRNARDVVEAGVLRGDDRHQRSGGANLMRHRRPCLVLLDLMMPVMNGWDFRRFQIADPALADIPVICLTAASIPRASPRN